ncbi:beta-ketoacyl synthase N-terminal-like domain-containing protein [Streptodolium elevatio]|uniref:Beta-ketoacyl synthase N-terminal-like domain-containing protein n=1 Tax=Streptodolium elevatio TaxID=3157996 RepID=A0ABV3DMX6_9ACTN
MTLLPTELPPLPAPLPVTSPVPLFASRPVITACGLAVSGVADERDLLGGPLGITREDPSASGPGLRHKDRASRMALRAVRRALDAAAIDAPAATAVVVSSNFGNLDTVCDFTDTIAAETVTGLSPLRVPHMSSHVTAAWVAIEHGLRGPNLTLCSGTPGGLDAVFWAAALLAAGRAEVAVVVGVEPDTAPVARLHRERGGTAWLDGAVCLVVENAAHAASRGARVRAAVSGYGKATDRAEAVRQALKAYDRPIGLRVAAGRDRPGPGARAGVGPSPQDGPVLDLTGRLGRCSGALGVLQCAAALAWFDRPAWEVERSRGPVADSVLAIAGAGRDVSAEAGPGSGVRPGTGSGTRAGGAAGADGEGDPSGVSALLLTRPAPDGSGRVPS